MKKILTLHFAHETNRFTPAPADKTAFCNVAFQFDEDVFPSHRGLGTQMGACLDVFEGCPEYKLIPTIDFLANPSGPVSAEVYDTAVNHVCTVLEQEGPVDGILIAFHGAMVAEGHHDGEGDFLEVLRAKVGPDIPIISSLDLHANITDKMAKYATSLVCYEEYPHIDTYETGFIAAAMMKETLEGKLHPVMAYRYIPHLLPLIPSADPAIVPLYQLARKLEQQPGIRCVRFSHGFFPADIPNMGMAVIVTADGDRDLAERTAEELANAIESCKDSLHQNYMTLDEALDICLQPGEGPVVLADASDNPGAGGMGDTTHILRRVLERGVTGCAMAIMKDPESVKACVAAGVGNTVKLSLGGKSDPAYSGGPLEVTAYVKAITDGQFRNKGKISRGALLRLGTTAVIEIAGNLVLVTSLNRQALDLEVFRSHGIAPEDQKVLIVKSAIHYRASYGTVARQMIPLSLPGYAVPVPDGFHFRYWKG